MKRYFQEMKGIGDVIGNILSTLPKRSFSSNLVNTNHNHNHNGIPLTTSFYDKLLQFFIDFGVNGTPLCISRCWLSWIVFQQQNLKGHSSSISEQFQLDAADVANNNDDDERSTGFREPKQYEHHPSLSTTTGTNINEYFRIFYFESNIF